MIRAGVSRRSRAGLISALVAACILMLAAIPASASGRVLLVCKTAPVGCGKGHFSTVQSAVNAAKSGDWILVWPAVYHEKGTADAGVYISKPGVHLRGMNRNRVVLDGTNPGASQPCSSNPVVQDLNAGN